MDVVSKSGVQYLPIPEKHAAAMQKYLEAFRSGKVFKYLPVPERHANAVQKYLDNLMANEVTEMTPKGKK
jgi:hypothetical protein